VNCDYLIPNVIGRQTCRFIGKIRMRLAAGGAPVSVKRRAVNRPTSKNPPCTITACLGGLRKTTKEPCQNSRCPGRDSNQASRMQVCSITSIPCKLLLKLKFYPTVAGHTMTTVCFVVERGRWKR
jgi:hypothetical protein